MVYVFAARFDAYPAAKIHDVLKVGVQAKVSGSKIIETLKAAGLTYRRTEMLHDVRRARAVEFAKTYEGAAASGAYFDDVYEPFRAKRGLTASETNEIFRKKERMEWETAEELEDLLEIEDRYVKMQEML